MQALSIKQPWAWLIVNGYKPVENRDWDTKFRGEFLIHAGKQYDRQGERWVQENFPEISIPALYMGNGMGGIVGAANLLGTVHVRDKHLLAASDKPWFFGEYGFILDNARPLPFMPLKGQLGFFNAEYREAA